MLTLAAFFVSTFGTIFFFVLLEFAILKPYQQWTRFFDKADKVFDSMLHYFGSPGEEE